MEKMREIARQNPENIRIIETSVNSDLQIEFFEALQEISDEDEDEDIAVLNSELLSFDTSIDRKKEILAIFTSLGEVESYRHIEEYLKIADEEIKTWAFLACQQGRMFLESRLLEESKIYIASGLGGKEHRLRYVFAFTTKDGESTDSQKNIIKGEIEYFLKKNDGLVEKIDFIDGFTVCTALIPIYINLIDLIQEIVSEINQYGDFLRENVFVTNEKQVAIDDLKDIFE